MRMMLSLKRGTTSSLVGAVILGSARYFRVLEVLYVLSKEVT
jgi:hypothetical protein